MFFFTFSSQIIGGNFFSKKQIFFIWSSKILFSNIIFSKICTWVRLNPIFHFLLRLNISLCSLCKVIRVILGANYRHLYNMGWQESNQGTFNHKLSTLTTRPGLSPYHHRNTVKVHFRPKNMFFKDTIIEDPIFEPLIDSKLPFSKLLIEVNI